MIKPLTIQEESAAKTRELDPYDFPTLTVFRAKLEGSGAKLFLRTCNSDRSLSLFVCLHSGNTYAGKLTLTNVTIVEAELTIRGK